MLKTECVVVGWIYPVQDGVKSRDTVNTIVNLPITFRLDEWLLASQEGLRSMELRLLMLYRPIYGLFNIAVN
jgi:hypothetical protein